MSKVIKHHCFDGFMVPPLLVNELDKFQKATTVEYQGSIYLLPLLSSSDVNEWATKIGFVYQPGIKAVNK